MKRTKRFWGPHTPRGREQVREIFRKRTEVAKIAAEMETEKEASKEKVEGPLNLASIEAVVNVEKFVEITEMSTIYNVEEKISTGEPEFVRSGKPSISDFGETLPANYLKSAYEVRKETKAAAERARRLAISKHSIGSDNQALDRSFWKTDTEGGKQQVEEIFARKGNEGGNQQEYSAREWEDNYPLCGAEQPKTGANGVKVKRKVKKEIAGDRAGSGEKRGSRNSQSEPTEEETINEKNKDQSRKGTKRKYLTDNEIGRLSPQAEFYDDERVQKRGRGHSKIKTEED